jgi:hypothetical protein
MIDDKGLTTILTIILTVYNTVAHNFSGKSSSKEGLKYLNYLLFFIIYKSIGVYTDGINMRYLFGKNTPSDYKNYMNKKFRYVDKLLISIDENHRNKLKNYLNNKNVFMFSNYTNYLDWLTGVPEHLIMGNLLKKAFESKKINKIKHLLILEVLYDFTNILDSITEYNNNSEDEVKIGILFFVIHFISVSSILLVDDKNLLKIVESQNFNISEFSKLLLTFTGYIVLLSTIMVYCILYLEDNTRRDYLKNIVIYTILIIYYTNYILKFELINNINEDTNISDKIKRLTKISLYAIYLYIFYPLVLFLID